MNISRARLRVAVVIPTALAGLVVSSMSGIASAAAPEPRTVEAAAPAAAPAPPSLGSASGFAMFVLPAPQPLCSGLATDTTSDPSIDREACGFVNFTPTGVTGALTGELYAEGASTPFATVPVTTPAASPELRRVSLQPDDTWPAGGIRLVIKEDTTLIGQFDFRHNQLVATLDTVPVSSAPGAAFDVTGSIEMHSARDTFIDSGVPATFTLNVVAADGTVLHTADLTAAAGGAIAHTVPGAATGGITADTVLRVEAVDAAFDDVATSVPPTGDWTATTAGATSHAIDAPSTELLLQNSFVSSVGWVKPGETYPSRIILTNPTSDPVTPTSVEIEAPAGSTIVKAGATTVNGPAYTWTPGAMAPGETKTLVLESKAATTAQLDTIVWHDLSTTAVLKVPTKADQTVSSHGPKVIPPSENFDTARYGDRPFPVVPVQYSDRAYQANHSGSSLETVINDPGLPGSTFNLFQEMSLGQLFPNGTVPSEGIASKDFTYGPGFDFTNAEVPGNTCHGGTYADLPVDVAGTPIYPERITNGVYNLPGQTEYYGSDSFGSAYVTAQTPAGIQDIDSGCGDTGKLVYDAAAIADPEIDYSDYDTDKDGVVDFFMVVFAGCGGNGGSQLAAPGDPLGACPYDEVSYDNIWPHSSTLEGGYTDPVTGLPGYTTDDQLKNLEGQPLWYTDTSYSETTTTDMGAALKVFVRVGPYNVNPETAIDKASVISHEYGHSLGLPDFYSSTGRETYGDWNLMATDKSQNMDAYSRQELGWVVPEVLDSSRVETDIPDSKVDIGTITWQKPDGTPYTLTDGADGVVHNSQMYVAKLPGRQLLDADAFTSGDGASPTHLWWSGSGNDFNCTPVAGHNLDLRIPQLADLTDPAATVTLSFKSRWDIEWDYDFGFVMTTTDGGSTYTSHESNEGYTTGSNTVPPATSHNACQDTYSNGLTGTSGSYQAGTEAVDRVGAGTYPEAVFLADSYDISDLAGENQGALRFSYVTDPGLSRPGWFIDDVKVTADPDGPGPQPAQDFFVSDFETSGDPDDPRIFNGGCREGLTTAKKCTQGWKYLEAGAESAQDHAYYLEMRDRSGFDFEGMGQIDREPIAFTPGFYLSYTDEAHGYGNTGTDDPPAQSPLDSVPQPGEAAPNLNDAAFVDTAERAAYTDDPATPHVDNYTDPSSDSGNWEFDYGCLGFNVNAMTGEDTIQLAGDLTGSVAFTMGTGCGDYDYGYTAPGGGGSNTAPVAAAVATPASVTPGQPVTLSAAGTTDAETPDDLDYSWDFGNGGATKDAEGKTATATYNAVGVYTATVTVTDPLGLNDTASATVTVTAVPGGGGGTTTPPKARIKLKSKKPDISRKVRLTARKSTGAGPLTYKWNFHNGGKRVDATTKRVKIDYKQPGRKKVTLTVIDVNGQQDKRTRKFRLRAIPAFTREATPTYDADDLARLLWPW